MATQTNELVHLLGRLQLDSDPVNTLKELKTIIQSVSPAELENLAGNAAFASVFDSLNSNDKEQIMLSCDILSKLMSSLKPNSVMDQFHIEIYRGLMHPEATVKSLALTQYKDYFADENLLQKLENSQMAVIAVIKLLAGDELDVVSIAKGTLTMLGKSVAGLNLFFAPAIVQELKELMQQSDVVRFRVYEVLVKVISFSPEGLRHAVETGLLQMMVNEYHQKDILVQLNCLELMSELAMVEHGLEYLEEKGLLRDLEKVLHQVNEDPLAGFLLPGLIKFFGSVGHVRPREIHEHHSSFLNLIFGFIENNDPQLLSIAIETIAILGSSVEGKLILDKHSDLMRSCMKRLGNIVHNAPSEMRVKALTSIALLLELKVDNQTTELLLLTETWFKNLSSQPMDMISTLSQQPFADLRCSALNVLHVLSQQPWGQRLMNSQPGFLEYLLDRNTEPDKEGKELKYEIVKTIVQSPTAPQIFDTVSLLRLREFFMEGAFYVAAQAEVALEGAA